MTDSEKKKIYKNIDKFEFGNWLFRLPNPHKEVNENMDFVKTILRSDKVTNYQKTYFWHYINFYENIDLVRECWYYMDWSTILLTAHAGPRFEKTVAEFLPYFDTIDWHNLECKLWNMSFDFIWRYQDKWSYRKDNNPLRKLWSGVRRDNTPFTNEQVKWIKSKWKRR